MGERQRVMIARALSTEPSTAARRRAHRQPRHAARARSARAAARALPRARGGGGARQPRPDGRRLRRPRVRAYATASSPTTTSPEPRSRAVIRSRITGAKIAADPRLGGAGTTVKLSNALRLYRVRLRARLLQECFAVVGIAAGVALLFASQVSSSSLQSSVAQLSHGHRRQGHPADRSRVTPTASPQSTLARVRHYTRAFASRRRCSKPAQTRRPERTRSRAARGRRLKPLATRGHAGAPHRPHPLRRDRRGGAARAARATSWA